MTGRAADVKAVTVTLSFDGGHPCDMRAAAILARHGVAGTFYVSWNHPRGPAISVGQMRELRGLGMEVGSHGWTHGPLTRRPRADVREELVRSRDLLEQALGEPVRSLSYPEGRANRMVRGLVGECGYTLARTTVAFNTAPRFDPAEAPITLQYRPRTKLQVVRHALRDGNLAGIVRWYRLMRCETDPTRLAIGLFGAVLEAGGLFHLCARSSQIEELGLWEPFEQVVGHIGRWDGVRYATNAGVAAGATGR